MTGLNFRFTGTGWPTENQDLFDLDLMDRLMLVVETYDDETVTTKAREVLGLVKGQLLTDALPLDYYIRRDIERLTFDGFAHAPESDFRYYVRLLARSASERRAKETAAQARESKERTCLYRFTDDAGRLLYVGISFAPDKRECQHRATQRWAPLIEGRSDEWFDTREEALAAELHAIRNESPLFNEAGRPRMASLDGAYR